MGGHTFFNCFVYFSAAFLLVNTPSKMIQNCSEVPSNLSTSTCAVQYARASGWLVGWLVVRHGCGGRCPPPPPGESSQRTYAASTGMGGALRRGRPPLPLPARSLPTLLPLSSPSPCRVPLVPAPAVSVPRTVPCTGPVPLSQGAVEDGSAGGRGSLEDLQSAGQSNVPGRTRARHTRLGRCPMGTVCGPIGGGGAGVPALGASGAPVRGGLVKERTRGREDGSDEVQAMAEPADAGCGTNKVHVR